MSNPPETIGSILDGLGVTANLDPDELIAGAVVLLKTVDEDGDVGLRIRSSDGLAYLERIGMFRTAEAIELEGLREG